MDSDSSEEMVMDRMFVTSSLCSIRNCIDEPTHQCGKLQFCNDHAQMVGLPYR